ncbi:MAG: ModE family transcriptional regulator [Bacteroidota bacterium]
MSEKRDIKYSNVRLKYKVWLTSESDEYILGDDIYRLLKVITEKESLSASAKENEISYRKAWGDLKLCEEKLGFNLLQKQRGGKDGGRTFLTEEGEKLLKAFDRLHSDFQKSVNDVIIDFKRTVKGKKEEK